MGCRTTSAVLKRLIAIPSIPSSRATASFLFTLTGLARLRDGVSLDASRAEMTTLIAELSRFPQAEIVWAQEEPKNMGAWSFVEPNIEWVLQHLAPPRGIRPRYVGRPASAATATGQASKHSQEQKTMVAQALSE